MNFNISVLAIPLLVAAAALGSAGLCSTTAAAEGETTLEQALSREYVRYNRALTAKDIPTILGMLTPDFSWNIGGGKTLNRQQTQAALREYFAGIRSVEKAKFRIKTISSPAPGQAQVVVTETVTALVSANSGNAQQRRRTTTENLRETWVQTSRGWKVKKSEILDSKETFAAVP